ncbi:MAG TPA: ABC transporter permease [Thermoplasmata archaeon]|nr:ABC transporter permease [Thermoplasmata archaeon]
MARATEPAVPGIGSALAAHLDRTFAIVDYEVRKLRHDPSELLLRAVQPALWLLVFGEVFTQVHVIPTGNLTYLQFLAPGILSQSVLFIAIFYGIASIRERELGIAYKFLVSPASRVSLVAGKALSASVRGLSQATIVYALAIALGVRPSLDPLSILGVLFAVVLGACLFATLSMIIASLVKTQERFLGIGQLLTMPLFFASSAIYPLSIMPGWLRPIALANPLTYLVDAVRTLMIPGASSLFPIGVDFAVLLAATVALVLLESRLYPRMAQ